MSVQVKNLNQIRDGGIYVSLEAGGRVSKEEAYLQFEMTWLRKSHKLDVGISRYSASHWDGDRSEERLTDWRVLISRSDPMLTDKARRAAQEEIEPIAQAWLASATYVEARQRAYFQAVRRVIGDERYDATRARRVLDLHRHELTPVAAAQLSEACDLLGRFLDSLKDGSL
jgi:hypothetical protein